MIKLLIIEDSEETVDLIRLILSNESDIKIFDANSIKDSINLIKKDIFDIILLDLSLPDGNGTYVCEQVRKFPELYGKPFIIALTADTSQESVNRNLELGCDDYIKKPFDTEELLIRLKKFIKRLPQNKEVIIYENIKLFLSNKTVIYNDEFIDLSKNEFELLYYFIINKGLLLTRINILDNVWKENLDISDKAVDQCLKRLRKKLPILNDNLISKRDKVTTNNFLDIDFFQTLQDRFAEEFGIASIITDVNGVPLTKPSNFTDFCINHVRGCEVGLKKCQFFDAYGGCKAKINKKPIIYPCHAGLIDFASPIIMGDTQVGCFLCGQVLTEKPDENKFRLYAKELGIDEDKYIEALRKVKILPYERIEYIANFLYKISSKMSNFIYYQNMGISANEFYKNCIDEFHKHLEANENNKTENKNFSFNNILSKIFETLKENYKIDEKELSRINKNSDNISEKSSSIIRNIQDTIKNFNNFDIS